MASEAAPSPPPPADTSRAPVFDPAPWLADLAQMRAALGRDYANLSWLLNEREVDLAGLFERAASGLKGARSEAEAIRHFEWLERRIGDGHVRLDWPRQPASAVPSPKAVPTTASFCAAKGYWQEPAGRFAAPLLAGFQPLGGGNPFAAGTIERQGRVIGFLRIGQFDPHGSPGLCEEAVRSLAIPIDRPCDASCDDAIVTHAYRRLTANLEQRLRELKARNASLLIVDIADNGGGSEWTEVAARMMSAKRLTSARLAVVRGPHWTRLWTAQAERLQGFADRSSGAERKQLIAWADKARSIARETARKCPPTGDPSCPWLVPAGFSTGLLGNVKAGEFSGKDWAVHVFNPAQHPYSEGIWSRPLVVLTDGETWSAAEQFAALLQDNGAALVAGSRTGGAGCGYSWGGTPTRLANTGAVLHLPDCARLRRDGSNEVRGVLPDVAIEWRASDGRALRASLLEAALPEIMRRTGT